MTTNIITTAPSSAWKWGNIIAGTALSLAISVVLLQFGSVIGLSATAPLRGEALIASWGVVATGIYLLWVQLMASIAGGYLAGRVRHADVGLSAHDNEMRDGLTGLLVWATGTVIAFIAASIGGAFATYVALHTDTYVVNEALSRAEKNAAIIFAFAAGATSLMSAAAAWWAGVKGGDHRDLGTDFSKELSFRIRK